MLAPASISTIEGDPIGPTDPEYIEMMRFESGLADRVVSATDGPHDEPWLNHLDATQPHTQPAIEFALTHPEIATRISGRVIDLAAGICWLAARLSRVDRVAGIAAVHLSRRFLSTVGERMIQRFDGDSAKITFAVSSFTRVPFPSTDFDCAFLVAAIRHSLTPIKTLMEAHRLLRPGGCLIVVESPNAVMGLEATRARGVRLSRETGVPELCYTRREYAYMLRQAGFDQVDAYPVDTVIRGAGRRALRGALRRFGIEDLIRPPTYIFVGTR
jgi:SAM-dependent methyltransferase